jgi:hypothetical protein
VSSCPAAEYAAEAAVIQESCYNAATAAAVAPICSSGAGPSCYASPAVFILFLMTLLCSVCPLFSLFQVLELLQADVVMRQAAAAAGPLPAGGSGAGGSGGAGPSCSASSSAAAAAAAAVPMAVELEGAPAAFAEQLTAEVEDLKAEMVVAHRDKRVLEEQYLAQIIAVSDGVVCGSDVGLVQSFGDLCRYDREQLVLVEFMWLEWKSRV